MLEARSVALVGASARPGSLGARMITEVARSPSRPRTYLVNPRYADIEGTPCLPSLAELPEPVDLALLAVPDSALEAQLGAAARSPGPFGPYLSVRPLTFLAPPGCGAGWPRSPARRAWRCAARGAWGS